MIELIKFGLFGAFALVGFIIFLIGLVSGIWFYLIKPILNMNFKRKGLTPSAEKLFKQMYKEEYPAVFFYEQIEKLSFLKKQYYYYWLPHILKSIKENKNG